MQKNHFRHFFRVTCITFQNLDQLDFIVTQRKLRGIRRARARILECIIDKLYVIILNFTIFHHDNNNIARIGYKINPFAPNLFDSFIRLRLYGSNVFLSLVDFIRYFQKKKTITKYFYFNKNAYTFL